VSPAAPTVVLVTVSALVAVVAIAAGWRWRSDALRCLVALGLGGVLITPVSWSHHFLWLSVMVAVLWRDGRPRWSVTLLVVMLAEPIVMDGLTQWAPPLVNALAGSTYTLCAVAALGYLVTAPAAPARDERAPLAESVAA
jgi:alpha-1,2-mannosyltransferase